MTNIRLTKAVAKLIISQPFYGTLACHLEIKEARDVPTMATDGKSLFYNPDFVATLDDDELLFVMAHEVGHDANLHHTRRGNRDPKGWNVAADYVVNGDLIAAGIGRMPAGALHDTQFAGWSAEDVYRYLAQQPQQSKPQPGEGEGDEGEGGGQMPGSDDPGGCGSVLDAGDDAGEIAEQEAEWQTVVRQAVNVATKQAGHVPASLQRLVDELKKPKHDWREILRRFVDPSSRFDYSWSQPDRRFGGQPFILPGMVTDGINHIAVVIDTSGSIDLEALRRFGGEVRAIAEQGVVDKVTVVYADCAVQRTEQFADGEPITFDPPQGGGTDFRPAIDWLEDHESDITAAVYFTDLDGPHGAEPSFPVLWATYGWRADEKRAPFGEVVSVND